MPYFDLFPIDNYVYICPITLITKYDKATKKAKIAWCEKYLTCVSEYHVVKYGTPKHVTAKIKDSILIDDNADVRKAWKNGATIDASNSEEMMKNLRQLLDTVKAA